MAKAVNIQYRRLDRGGLPWPNSPKSEIVRAMRSQRGGRVIGQTVGLRKFDLDQDGKLTLLNRITDDRHWDQPFFGGQLAYFERGANVPAILGDPDAQDVNELDLGQFGLGEGASMIHGLLYFVVVGDHLGIIESVGFKSGRFERYLRARFRS